MKIMPLDAFDCLILVSWLYAHPFGDSNWRHFVKNWGAIQYWDRLGVIHLPLEILKEAIKNKEDLGMSYHGRAKPSVSWFCSSLRHYGIVLELKRDCWLGQAGERVLIYPMDFKDMLKRYTRSKNQTIRRHAQGLLKALS